jgi:type IV pilus assembly protein PilB
MKRRRVQPEAAPTMALLIPDPSAVTPGVRIGDLLVESGAVARDALESALAGGTGQRTGVLLIERGLLEELDITRALGRQLSLPVTDLRDARPEAAATALVDAVEAHRHGVLPMSVENGTLHVAIADPVNNAVLALLRSLPVAQVHLALGAPTQLRNLVNRTYQALSAVAGDIEAFRASEVAIEASTATVTNDVIADAEAPIVQVVNKILTQALRDRASDVHIEEAEAVLRVRFRIDGALKDVVELPGEMGPALISRLKIMAGMNIVERRRPQDGQFEMEIDGRSLDVRVATTSTIWGEKTVLRLLDRMRSLYRLSDLGMAREPAELYSRIVNTSYGMVIVGGPTGSGKTTTLYATLSEVNRSDINVMTIEDPVEYVFNKVNQIQISDQAGLSFATGLKSILRQDPDVILVGEVRDVETARIAVQSALTGHRVFTSIHAVDAVASLYRLLDMGIEPYLVTSAIVGVVAQRLVRRICKSCATSYEPTMPEITMFRKLGGEDMDVWLRGSGCQLCADTGYFDRVGVYEVLPITDEIRQCVVEGRLTQAARDIAEQQGMRTLKHEAVRMVEAGVTTLEEVVKNVLVSEGIQ